jgi:hypothetical protein
MARWACVLVTEVMTIANAGKPIPRRPFAALSKVIAVFFMAASLVGRTAHGNVLERAEEIVPLVYTRTAY